MDIETRLRNGITKKPRIICSPEYVLIGSTNHGQQLPQDGPVELINSLIGVAALKMEGPEEAYKLFHPMSAEIITKASVGIVPISYLPEYDGEGIGQKLLKYGVSEELAEIYVPCMYIRMQGGDVPDNFLDLLPVAFIEYKKQRFGFIDIERAVKNFLRVAYYWKDNNLDPIDLDHFSYDFEKFMGDVREFEYWKPDLVRFRKQYSGRIAVCCGDYHIPFVQSVLQGKEQISPDWKTHIDNRREDMYTPQSAEFVKKVYLHLEKALR